MEQKIEAAAFEALKKRQKIIDYVKSNIDA